MLIMRGSLALSHFRLERLLAKINDIVPQVNSISAEYLYFIDLEERLTKAENSILSSLLSYSHRISKKTNQSLILVLPKSGVISIWSKKATDIGHDCTLNKIRRIERGIAYSIEASERLTWGDEQAIAALVYHPQTETVFYRLQDTKNGKRVALGYHQPIINREEFGSVLQENTQFQNNAISCTQESLTFAPIILLQALRGNPRCAKKQFEVASNCIDPGLNVDLTFDPNEDIVGHFVNVGVRPRIAILREQGTHGHIEMAAAFNRANFECVDIHMRDLQNNAQSLAEFKGVAVCGGFSFTLGLSNGCQMLAALKTLIPGAKRMQSFAQNYSEQFESRLCLVEIQPSAAILLQGMEGSRLLVPVAHQEGRVVFEQEGMDEEIIQQGLVALRYVDNWGRKTKTYPANPNGSPLGIAGLTTTDGRVLCMMPHSDRVFRTVQHSWHPGTWGEDGPWLRMFQNARKWVG